MFKKKQTENKTGEKLLNEKLMARVQELEVQVDDLKQELETERNKPKDGFEEAKRLIVELEGKKQEYQSLLDELEKIKQSYLQKIEETKQTKLKYELELNKLLSEIRDGINKKDKLFK